MTDNPIICGMTQVQLAQVRALIEANRQPVHRGEQYAHPRGWNDALSFVERVLKETLGERDGETPEAQPETGAIR